MKKNHIDIISMGCSKNLVDSERLLRRLEARGYTVAHDPALPQGEYVVVNTCGFIADAKQESIDMLLELAQLKEQKKIGRIVVMGCLSQRYMDDLKAEMPEIDVWYGKFDWKNFIETLPDRSRTPAEAPRSWERRLTTPPHSAYLKISEGCNRFCAFCAIPLITGRHTSRPVGEIADEVRQLVKEGVKEFNVIAQDLSSYGTDLYGSHQLARLVETLAQIPGVEWIRLHYAYPSDFPMDVLDVMARYDNVCKYIDIALQHIADPVLQNMRRHIDARSTVALLDEMRRRVPGLKIRTTLMVGFPGEGEKEFEELLDFVRTQRFDRMGAFAYCEEDDTWGARHLDDNIPDHVKQQRLDRLMEVQQQIADDLQQQMKGQTVRVLVDRIEEGNAVGRTQWDSPEVDPEFIITGAAHLRPGQMVEATVTDAGPFELYGQLVKEED